MARKRRTRKRRLVLDIGASAIRLCELTPTRTGYQLTKYLQRETFFDPSTDEDTKRQVRADAVRALIREGRVRSRKVVLAVPGQAVFTRPRPLPPVPEYKVTQIVRYEIQQQIPFSLDQIALDYQVLDRIEGGGYFVLMAAIKVDIVDRYLKVIEDARCRIDVVDVAPLAAYNWLRHTGELGQQGDCVAMIDIGASTTEIVIERDNQFRWNRPLSIGGNDVTAAIAADFNLSFEEAERVKRERGFAPTGDAQRDGKAGETIGRVLGRLTTEIQRSFSYYRSQPGGGTVSRIVLTGGGASLRNIVPYLQRTLGMDVRIAQPLSGVAVAPAAQSVNDSPEQAAVALGLALRCTAQVPIEVNLIPPRVLEAARRREQVLYWGMSLVTILMIMASIIPARANRQAGVLENIDLLKSSILQYDGSLRRAIESREISGAQSEFEKELKQLKAQVNDLKALGDVLDDAYRNRIVWLQHLNTVNAARIRVQEADPSGESRIYFSSVESSVIGAEAERMGGGGMGGMMGGMMGGGMPGMPGMPGMGGGSSQSQGRRSVPSSGFPGIGAGSGMGGGMMGGPGGMMGGAGGMMGGPGGGGMGMPGMPGMPGMGGGSRDGEMESQPIPRPNGIIVRGYASSPETVLAFRDRLVATEAFVENGVYLDEGMVNRVDASVLYNADVGGTSMGGMGGLSGGLGGRGGMVGGAGPGGMMGGMMPGGIGGGLGGMGGGGGVQFQQGPSVIAFRMDLQFWGEAYDFEKAGQGPSSGMMGGFSFPSMMTGSGTTTGTSDDDDDE